MRVLRLFYSQTHSSIVEYKMRIKLTPNEQENWKDYENSFESRQHASQSHQ